MASVDPAKPNTARMYDYWLGGSDNFQVDRDAAEAVRRNRPDVAELALDNKKFLTRAVRYVAAQGVRQFLDIGSGLPTSPPREFGIEPLWLATHEAAGAARGAAVVAYVDHDPVAVTHSRTLLASGSERVTAILGDMRDPAAIFADEHVSGIGFNLAEPAGLVLGSVLHFLEPSVARQTVATFAQAMAPGSYVIISIGYDGELPPGRDFADAYNAQQGPRVYRQTRDGIMALFDGLEIVFPGVVDAATWRAGHTTPDHPERAAMMLGGVARAR
jgi:O-methyltransferase involved in polyketide biosynthesis